MQINSMCSLTHINEKMVQMILHEYSIPYFFTYPQVIRLYNHELSKISWFQTEIFNADVIIREDITQDQLIDVIVGNRVYLKCLYVKRVRRRYIYAFLL